MPPRKPAPRQPAAKKKAPSKKATASSPPPPPKAKPGKAAHIPTDITRRLVELAMLNQYTHKQTAALLKVGTHTLEKYYADELADGMNRILAMAAGNLYRIATQTQDNKAAVTAAIFLLKAKGKYDDKAGEKTGSGGGLLGALGALGGDGSERAPLRMTLVIGEKGARD